MTDSRMNIIARVDDQFSRPLAGLRDQLKGLSAPGPFAELRKNFQGVHSIVQGVNANLRGVLPVLDGIGIRSVGVAGAIAGIGLSLRNFGTGVENVSMLSREVGVATNRLRAWVAAGERFGLSADAVKNGFKAFADGMFDVRKRTVGAYNDLRQLNLAGLAEDLAKSLTNEEALERVFRELPKIPSPVMRRRVLRILGLPEEWSSISDELHGQVRAFVDRMEKENARIGDSALSSAKRFNDAWSSMERRVEAAKHRLLAPAMEITLGLADVLNTPIDELDDGKGRPNSALRQRRAQLLSRKRILEDREALNEGPEGEAGQGARTRQRIEELNRELRTLGEEIRKLNRGDAIIQKQSMFGGPENSPVAKFMLASLMAGRGGGGGFGGGGSGDFVPDRAAGGDRASRGGFVPRIVPDGGFVPRIETPRIGGGGGIGEAIGRVRSLFAQDGEGGAVPRDERERVQRLMRRLVQAHGWTPEAAATAAGQAVEESRVLPNGRPGDRGTAFGMFQWRHGRFAALQRFAASRGKPWTDFDTQVDFFNHERQNGTPGAHTPSGLERNWHALTDLGQGNRAGYFFERYAGGIQGQRLGHAMSALRAWRAGGGTGLSRLPDSEVVSDAPGRRPGDALMGRAFGQGAAAPQAIQNSGTVHVYLAPGLEHTRARVSMDGLFNESKVSRGGRHMASATEGGSAAP